jgi:hypothetical protein
MRFIRLSVCLLLVISVYSCSKKSTGGSGGGGNTGGGNNGGGGTTITPIITLPQGWKYSATYSSGFPTGIQSFTFDSTFAGRNVKAFCVAYDSKLNKFDFKPVLSATAKKPSEFFTQEGGVTYACINGGFFGSGQSFSLVKYNGTVSSANIKVVNRNYNGNSTPYYPTRCAFGINAAGTPSTGWVYSIGAGNDNIYSYPSPSPNAEGSAPQQVPTETFPAGGTSWATTTAIGGSPMLLKGGLINISDVAELISINNTTSRPRSAIGYTNNGMVILLAVEGDNVAAGYPGVNLTELATMLKDLGCTDAINLDGGGSTNMILANRATVRPGDNGTERPVISAVLIKLK